MIGGGGGGGMNGIFGLFDGSWFPVMSFELRLWDMFFKKWFCSEEKKQLTKSKTRSLFGIYKFFLDF